jgi:hypothetical protein
MRPRSGAVRASVCGRTARRVTAAATGPGTAVAGASVVMAAMTASRAVRDSSGSRWSSGHARRPVRREQAGRVRAGRPDARPPAPPAGGALRGAPEGNSRELDHGLPSGPYERASAAAAEDREPLTHLPPAVNRNPGSGNQAPGTPLPPFPAVHKSHLPPPGRPFFNGHKVRNAGPPVLLPHTQRAVAECRPHLTCRGNDPQFQRADCAIGLRPADASTHHPSHTPLTFTLPR